MRRKKAAHEDQKRHDFNSDDEDSEVSSSSCLFTAS